MAPVVNVLVSSFSGLDMPPTLCVPLSTCSCIRDLASLVADRLSISKGTLTITTNSNRAVSASSGDPLASLLSSPEDAFLSLRISAPLCGGKGGFGSQLRAAGGRMSSRKQRSQGDSNGSSRNLDGRRLRTVTEAKALAEYLALKPEMEKKEKDERRRRWEQIVELTERKQEDIKNGGKARLDGRWAEAKDEVAERTREAVSAASRSGAFQEGYLQGGSDASASSSDKGGGSDCSVEAESSSPQVREGRVSNRQLFGWDEDEDVSEESDDDENGDEDYNGGVSDYDRGRKSFEKEHRAGVDGYCDGKGKGRAL